MPHYPFPTVLLYISSNRRSILSLSTRFFASSSPKLNDFPEKPTASYYDDLVKKAGHKRDFKTLRHLLNKRIRDSCLNTTNTFNFITNTAGSLSVLDDVVQTLAGLDPGYPRKNAFESLIARLCKLDRKDESLRIVDVMVRGEYGLSVSTFYPILKCVSRKEKMEDAWRLVDLMKAYIVCPDITAYNYLLKSHCFAGDLMAAIEVMERIKDEGLAADSKTYDALVLGACRADMVEGALVLLRRMEDDGVPVLYSTYTHVIDGLLELGYYQLALKFVIIYGGKEEGLDKVNFRVLATKLIKFKMFEEAKLVLGEMEKKGLVSEELRDFFNRNLKNVVK